MEKFMSFMQQKFTPIVNKITKNPWVAAVQDSMMTILPLILVGSLITVLSLLQNVIPNLPDFSLINSFTFGLLGLFVTFLIPYFIMEKKGYNNKKIIAGATGISLYMLLLSPTFSGEGTITYLMSRFGATGMFLSITIGMFVGLIMTLFSKKSFFSEESLIPDFVVTWFDSLLPITLLMIIGWVIAVPMHVDFFEVILMLFKPLSSIVQSYPGFVLSVFIPIVLYTFGILEWTVEKR